MGVHEGRGQLGKIVKNLTQAWQETRAVWDDPISEKLNEEFIEPVETDLKNAMVAMDQMAVLISTIKRECE